MRSLLWFLLGIIGGFVAAHVVNKNPRGAELLAEVDARISEFTDRMGDAYREQQERFADIVDEITDAAEDAIEAGTDAAAAAIAKAKASTAAAPTAD
jgi:hypothetical protein